MSLTSALYNTISGLSITEAQIGVVSSNVSNADKAGYSRKDYELSYQLTSGTSVPVGGEIVSANVNSFLFEAVLEDITTAAGSAVTAEYLTYLSDQLGTTQDSTTLSSALDDLATAFDELAVTPEDDALKAQVVSAAEAVASQLRNGSNNIQSLRTQADQAIATTVDKVNDLVVELDKLNQQISQASIQGISVADLTDERDSALQELAGLVDIQYFTNSDNELQVYLDGYALLSSQANTLSYDSAGILNADVAYPAQLNGIMLNGVDITNAINGGELGALIELRDTILVQEQDKLDEMASVLISQVNELANQGASIPAPSTITGEVEGLTVADAFPGTGFARIAVTDAEGNVTNFHDFDLSVYVSVGALITDIGTQLGGDVTASLNADGALQITANNSGEGIMINELDSSVGADSLGFSNYFGLNGVFAGEDASDITVSTHLQNNADLLATGRLSSSATLAVGDTGLFAGDSDLAKELNELFYTDVSYNSAGNFAAQTASILDYGAKIMSDLAGRASDATNISATDALVLEQTLTSLQNLEGVNIDEEMAELIDLESKYEAAATLIGIIQEMFDSLLAAVR